MIQVTREIHDAPAAIQERVARAGGANRFGEPNFRVVWGGARLAWIATFAVALVPMRYAVTRPRKTAAAAEA